jgi:iron complex outermembrane receptor protein
MKLSWLSLTIGALLLQPVQLHAQAPSSDAVIEKFDFHIPAQRADKALTSLAQQAGVTLIFNLEKVWLRRTNSVDGVYSLPDALEALLKGSGLEGVVEPGKKIVIREQKNSNSDGKKGEAPVKAVTKAGIFGSLVTLFVGAPGAIAQTTTTADKADKVELEEIVVTARKRSESIQDAPVTIVAFNDAQIQERGVHGLADLAKFTPGLTFFTGTSRASSNFSVRGMTQISAVGDNRRDLVTVFVDGVPLVGPPGTFDTEDLQRVEVVKGPQSALFGRATFGGAINMITTVPGNEFKAGVSATAASYGDYRLSASLEGPIAENLLSGRLVVDGRQFDGFYKNALGGKLGDTKNQHYVATLNLTPTENLSLRLRHTDRHDEDGEQPTPLIARYQTHNCGPFPGFLTRALAGLPAGFTVEQSRKAYCGELKAPSGPISINNVIPTASIGKTKFDDHKVELDHTLSSANLEWSFLDGHTLTAIASTQEQEVATLLDFERAPEDRYQAFSDTLQKQDSYELRVSSPASSGLNWMLGVAQLKATFSSTAAFINGTLFGPTAGGPAAASLVPAVSGSKTDSVFGSLGYNLTDALNVGVEVRRQKDIITSGIGLPTKFDVQTTATLPRFLVRYALSGETNLYANYAKGNQPTQGYATFFQLSPAQQAVALKNGVSSTAPEAVVKNYEVGIKHRADDNSWYLNASVYYLEWIGRQGVRTIQVDLNGDGVITNLPAPAGENFNAVPFAAGDSNTRGVELDGAVSLTRNLTLGGNIAYADTKITKALNESLPLRFFGLADAKGFKFPLAPDFSGAMFLQYENALSADRKWFARGDMTYIGKRYDSIVNFAYVPVQIRTNVRVGLKASNWEAAVFVNNLFDDRTLESARYNSDSAADPFFFQLAASEAVLANKRQIGITASYKF